MGSRQALTPKGRGETMRDLLQNTHGVIQNPFIRQPQHGQTFTNHISIAVLVMMPLLIQAMYAAVAFNDQLGFTAVEVSHVIAELMLPSEFETQEAAISQQLPQEFLCGRLTLSQFTSKF